MFQAKNVVAQKRKRPNLGPTAVRDLKGLAKSENWMRCPNTRPTQSSYFDFFFAFFFLLAMMVFLDV
jgi:hypothetical protein